MNVFVALLAKELRFWFTRPGVHLFALLFFTLGVLSMLAMGGAIEFIQIGGMGGLKKADSPLQFTLLTTVWGLLATMNLAAAAGGAATRDVTEGSHPLVYSTPVSKWTFLAVRYLGAITVSTYLITAIPLGMLFMRLLPVLETERMGALAPLPTVLSLILWQGPNILFVTALFFGIGALTRRMFPIYIGGVFLLVGYLGSSAFTADLDDQTIAVMLDPFGMTALQDVTRYWSAEQSNTLIPWPTGRSLANRVLWMAIGVGVFAASAFFTRLDQDGWQPLARFARKPASNQERFDETLPVPTATRTFGSSTRWAQVYSLSRRSVLDVVGHRYFWGFVSASVLFQLLNSQSIGSMYGTTTFPVTYAVLDALLGSLQLFVVMVLTFYAGDLVWAERDNGQSQLLDSSPVPDAAFVFAKALALVTLVVALHLIPMILGPLIQLASGYTVLEPGQYLQSVALSLLDWAPFIGFALAVHVLVNNKMVGHAILLGFWILQIFRGQLGFEHNVFWMGSDPGRMYSDMNAWGHALNGFLLHKVYWMAFGLLLLGVARLFWVRGTLSFTDRWTEARRRLDRPTVGLLAVSGAAWLGLGGVIVYQTNVVGTYQNSVDEKRQAASIERTYKADWDGRATPIITVIDTSVDLFPDEGRAEVAATFVLKNTSEDPIPAMLVAWPSTAKVRKNVLSVPVEIDKDAYHEVETWTFEQPIQPGEELTLSFETTYLDPGLQNAGFEQVVVPNGTMLHHYYVFPSFGYDRSWEVTAPSERRKYDLPERKRMRDLDDPEARLFNYITDDAHRIVLTARVSTVKGQIPMAPGDLIDEGVEGDRVWRVYRPRDPSLYLYAFLSAAWDVRRSEQGRVPVEVYFHPAHAYNVDRMLEAVNESIAMFERDFGPFQHEILRIIEFPRYSSHAQSLPAMVPFSEGIGFIAQLDDPEEDIDYVYYVTAHEVAHQWWAHQVCGGDGQGATVLTESLSQYGALKVMEAEYGPERIQKFLKYESDRYFRGRSNEDEEEQPLMRTENQQYIHYQKGGFVFYTLSERIGRERFDAAIKGFLEQWRLVGPPYPTARDLVDHLHAAFPEHREAIADGFERIVMADIRLKAATWADSPEGLVVELEVHAERVLADGKGRETRSPFLDTTTVQVELAGAKHTQPLALSGSPTHRVVFPGLSGAPSKVTLDPRALILEQQRDDNSLAPTAR